MSHGLPVSKYKVTAAIEGGVVLWSLGIETENGDRHEISVRDGEEIPILLAMAKGDGQIFYDAATGRLTTGWNDPGI